jgi:hypothetical protein
VNSEFALWVTRTGIVAGGKDHLDIPEANYSCHANAIGNIRVFERERSSESGAYMHPLEKTAITPHFCFVGN